MSSVICISHATRDECIARGIAPEKCRVIPVGIRCADTPFVLSKEDSRRSLEKLIGAPIGGKRLLVTVGRLVRRKGVAWFVEHVMPALDNTFQYLIVGDGPDRAVIKELIREKRLSRRTFLAGRLKDHQRDLVLKAADIFIMPNIPVAGDIEGFGIVVLEAGRAGLPVIASDMEGMRDAVIQGQTGFLVEAGNPEAFIQKINSVELEPQVISRIVAEKFDWTKVAEYYFNSLLGSGFQPGQAS